MQASDPGHAVIPAERAEDGISNARRNLSLQVPEKAWNTGTAKHHGKDIVDGKRIEKLSNVILEAWLTVARIQFVQEQDTIYVGSVQLYSFAF